MHYTICCTSYHPSWASCDPTQGSASCSVHSKVKRRPYSLPIRLPAVWPWPTHSAPLSFSLLSIPASCPHLPPPDLLTHTNAAVAQVGRHNEASALIDTHAHETSVHASDEAAYTHNDGHQGVAVIAGGVKGQMSMHGATRYPPPTVSYTQDMVQAHTCLTSSPLQVSLLG